MADIELVIKIPETLKKIADEEDYKTFSHPVWQAILMERIQNGSPLPKGHGKLIDVDTLEFRNVTVSYGYDWECGESTYAEEEIVRADDIWNAPTIIEADKEDKE